LSLAIVGSIITIAILISLIRTWKGSPIAGAIPRDKPDRRRLGGRLELGTVPPPTPKYIHCLTSEEPRQRAQAAENLFSDGTGRILGWISDLEKDEEFRNLLVQEQFERPYGDGNPQPRLTVGIAVLPETFDKIRAANGSPPLAETPPDQDVLEFELEFSGDYLQPPRLDILTTKALGGGGAIARFLEKFGEGIQQVEIDVTDVDRATEILRTRFQFEPIYPATRPGANRTRVNFFLATVWNAKKVLIELVEQPNNTS
jgi:hypothetical protein